MSTDETPAGTNRSCEQDAAAELAGMTIAQIRAQVAEWKSGDPSWALLEKDRRVGVPALGGRAAAARCAGAGRISARRERLLHFERHLWAQGVHRVAGVDEAGRGCLAGPVVAAAVVLSPDGVSDGIDDSKKLSRTQRETLYEEIVAKALAVGIGQVEAEEIDQLNILQASLKAMRLALENLPTPPDRVLIDGASAGTQSLPPNKPSLTATPARCRLPRLQSWPKCTGIA